MLGAKREKGASLEKWIYGLLFGLLSVMLVYTIHENYQVMRQQWTAIKLVAVTLIGICVVLFALLLGRLKKVPRWTILVVLGIAFSLRLVYAATVKTPIVSDFSGIYSAAQSALTGDFSWLDKSYFRAWAYQVPYVLYHAAILRVWNAPEAIQFVDILFMTGTVYLIYKISACAVSKKSALLAALLYAIYPAPIFYSSVLTNQHSSTFLMLLSIFLLCGKLSWKRSICAGLSAAVGNLIRTEGTLFIVAIAALALLRLVLFLRQKNKEAFAQFKQLSIGVASFFLISLLFSGIILQTPFGQNGLENNYPQWKFLLGLNPASNGKYTSMDADIFKIADNGERWQVALTRIQQNLKGHSKYTFFKNKTTEMWATPETAGFSIFHMNKYKPVLGRITAGWIFEKLFVLEKGIYLVILQLVALGAAAVFLRKKSEWRVFPLIEILAMGNYMAYTVIEIQIRYRYTVMPVLFIGAAFFLDILINAAESNFAGIREWRINGILRRRTSE